MSRSGGRDDYSVQQMTALSDHLVRRIMLMIVVPLLVAIVALVFVLLLLYRTRAVASSPPRA
jgi:hypothetical protein